MKTRALTHVAMSVPVGALTPEVRAEILAFYGDVFGWREMEGISNDERPAMWVGRDCYINVREREDHAELSYEHFGVRVESLEQSHLLPMAIEVQYFPEASS